MNDNQVTDTNVSAQSPANAGSPGTESVTQPTGSDTGTHKTILNSTLATLKGHYRVVENKGNLGEVFYIDGYYVRVVEKIVDNLYLITVAHVTNRQDMDDPAAGLSPAQVSYWLRREFPKESFDLSKNRWETWSLDADYLITNDSDGLRFVVTGTPG